MEGEARAPSWLDDAATVVATRLRAHPVLWLALVAGVSAFAAFARLTTSPVSETSALALAPAAAGALWSARDGKGLMRASWLLGVAAVLALWPLSWNLEGDVSEAARRTGVGAVITLCLFAGRRRVRCGGWDVAIVATAAAVVLLARNPGRLPGDTWACWTVALGAAVFVAPTRLWFLGILPLVVAALPPDDAVSGIIQRYTWSSAAQWLPHVLLSAIGFGFCITVAVRAGRLAVVATPESADAAASRLAVRAQRHPWRVLLVAAVAGARLDVLTSLCSVASPFSRSAVAALGPATAAALHVALAVRGTWSLARALVAFTFASVFWTLYGLFVGRVSSGVRIFTPETWFVVLSGPSIVIVGWLVARRRPGARSVGATVVVTCMAVIVVVYAALGERSFGTPALSQASWLLRTLAWGALLHVAATSTVRPLTLSAVCVVGGVGMSLLTWALESNFHAYVVERGWPLVVAGGSVALLPFVFWALVARRIRSLCAVPDDHPLVADYGVDLRPRT